MMPSSNDGEHIPSNRGVNLPNGSHDTDIHDWMKSADGKFVSLENDSRSMKDKMETLQSTSERMEEFIKAHFPIINLAAATSNSLGGGPTTAAVLTGEPEAKDGVAVKKKKKKKKKKGGNKVVMNWVAGNLAKITVGLFSIALLVSVTLSMTLGQGEGGIGGTYRSLLRKQTRRSYVSKIESTVDSQHKPNEEQLEDDGGEKVSHQRTTQANSMPPTSSGSDSSSSLYYPVWKNGGHCDNDSSQRPSNYNELSVTLFETAEECCNRWFASQDDNECMENSPSPHPQTNPVPEDVETGVPTSSTTASDSPTAPDLPDSSQQQQPNTATETDNEASNGSNGPTAISFMASFSPSTSDPSNSPQDSTAPLSGIPPNASGAPEDVDTSYPTFSPAMDPDPTEDTTGEESTEPICDADPEKCGCPYLNQTDYGGSINTTGSGIQCVRWDAIVWLEETLGKEKYTNAGLEENFCRNPHRLGGSDHRAWCYTDLDGDWGYCSVPKCRRRTPMCTVADKETCGCEDVKQSDYRGTISKSKDDFKCERWGAGWGEEYTNAGLEENFCRNPFPEEDNQDNDRARCIITGWGWKDCNVTMCNPCECMPSCGSPHNADCGCPSFFQAEECCDDDDASSCKCTYLKDACRISLEKGSEDFCDDAEIACYEDNHDQDRICGSGMYEQMCYEFPNKFTCDLAAKKCCDFDVAYWSKSQCLCDFYTSTTNALSYGSKSKSDNCIEAATEYREYSAALVQYDLLESFYEDAGGEHWLNKTGWLSDTIPPCQWFGLTCTDGIITEINLRNNNLTGVRSIYRLGLLAGLTKLDIAENNLSGTVYIGVMLFLQKLVHVDISNNEFSGHADMTFSPATKYADFSHNKFSSVGFKRFNAAYETLQMVDLSNNEIDQAASEVFLNIPPNLEELILSNNAIRGAFPDPFPNLDKIRRFATANNNINGSLPDFSRATPRVRELDLSNQRQTDNGGLTGTISADFSRLDDLLVLNLAVNNLTSIPSDLGNLGKLKVLNFSSNVISQQIPPELGKLADSLEVLDLSDNKFEDYIPSQFASFVDRNTSVDLSGNTDITDPAPLMLCFLPKFDLANNASMCPPERNALKDFYESAKGSDWTNNTEWLDPYETHCSWHGVKCSANNTTELKLINNGLSGTLSEKIANLSFLEVLDLSDNDIKGEIPTEIGLLSRLIRLRLPYNEFIGSMPEIRNSPDLKLIQLHGNRISGTIPKLNWVITDPSSFVTDCGNPSDFDQSLVCEECTMCCNAQGDCHSQKETDIQKVGIDDYTRFSWIFFACLLGVSCALALTLFAYDKYRTNHNVPGESIRRPSSTERDSRYALDAIGEGSVYQFFLGKSWLGWTIALATIGIQIFMLFVFVDGAEIDLSDDKTDLVYTWKCPLDQDECENKIDLDWKGWTAFAILMAAHLLKDIINGSKMIVLSGKERHDRHARISLFSGGTLLTSVSLFTLFVSTIYNMAIATSNTEIIMNSVVILFINDVDELIYDILMVINSRWVEGMSWEKGDDGKDRVKEVLKENSELKNKVKRVESEVDELRRKMTRMEEMMGIEDTPTAPQDDDDPTMMGIKETPTAPQDDDDPTMDWDKRSTHHATR